MRHGDLTEDFETLRTGEGDLSWRFLHLIRTAVVSRFMRLNVNPERNFCDSDIDDVCQELIIEITKLVRKRSISGEDGKSRFLIAMAHRYPKFLVPNHQRQRYSLATHPTQMKRNPPGVCQHPWDQIDDLPGVRKPIKSDWMAFEDWCASRLPENTVRTAIALASCEQDRERERSFGISNKVLRNRRRDLRKFLSAHRDKVLRDGVRLGHDRTRQLLGGLEPAA